MADEGGGEQHLGTVGVPAAAVPTDLERQFNEMKAQLALILTLIAAQEAQAANTAPAGAGMAAVMPAGGGAAAASNDGANMQQMAANNETDTTALDALNTARVDSGVDAADGAAYGVKRHFPAYILVCSSGCVCLCVCVIICLCCVII